MRAIAAVMTALVLSVQPAFAGPDGAVDLFNVPLTGFSTYGATDLGSCSSQPTPFFGGAVANFGIALHARLTGASVLGISGAELYIAGLERTNTTPPGNNEIGTGWQLQFNPAPGLTVLTSPFAPHVQGLDINRRGNLTWSVPEGYNDVNCQKTGLVFLGRIEATNTSGSALGGPNPNNHYVSVVAAMPPTNPAYVMPTLINCNFPSFEPPALVTGGQFIINPTGAMINASCSVAVSQDTWGGVKSLYR